MKQRNITIKDVASALNLSFSTVARALKDNPRISEETRKKVKDYAKAHNYRPNLMAAALKNKSNRSIGVLVCNISNSFFAEVLNGIESVAADKGYQVIISQSHESSIKELQNLQNLLWRSVDGLLISLSTETQDVSHFQLALDNGTPIVFFDRITDLINTHKVSADNRQGSYELTRHLLSNGYRRIGHITSSPFLSITQERLEGYKQALQDNGLAVDANLIQFCNHGGMIDEEIEQALKKILSNRNPVDALIAASDRLTIKCFSILKQKNIPIPEKVAMAGFSNFGAADLFNPSLTAVVQPAFEMGKSAAELLIRTIESKRPFKTFEKKILRTDMVIRESTKRKPV